VLSTGVPVAGMPWMVFHEIDETAARAPLSAYRWSMIAFMALFTALLVAGFVAVWWRQASEHTRALAVQFRDLSTQINAQRRLLDSILNNVHEMIGLKSVSGTYSYANRAFQTAIGRTGEQIAGLDDTALFGHGTAERLRLQDQSAIRGGTVVTFNEEIYLGSKLHHFQISKVPFVDESGAATGIVSVARDITEIVENERRRQRAVEQMTRALMRTIEGVDPYLAGHAARVQRFCSALARRLTLSPRDALTVEIAAAVCQVGKTAIPKEIVAKQGRLTPEEFNIMKTHIDHAVAILSSIDFELPIVDVVARMHERLDGSGYPKGLKGAEIGTLGGILGICDVFCARIEPRSYRHRLTPDEALTVLKENAGRYDANLVAALAEVVHSVEGEKLVAAAQS
jgi:PAS domain S-box-containing protein